MVSYFFTEGDSSSEGFLCSSTIKRSLKGKDIYKQVRLKNCHLFDRKLLKK